MASRTRKQDNSRCTSKLHAYPDLSGSCLPCAHRLVGAHAVMMLMDRAAVSTAGFSSGYSRRTSLVPSATQRPSNRQRHTALNTNKNKIGCKGFGKKQGVPPDDAVLWQQLLSADCPGLQLHTMGRPQPAALPSLQAGDGQAPYVGPVSLQVVPGCGRGLVVTRDVQQGEVLLVANPLVLASRAAGQMPQPSQLVPLLMQGLQMSYQLQPTEQAAAAVEEPHSLHSWRQAFWTLYGGTQQSNTLPSTSQDSSDKPLNDLLQLASVTQATLQQQPRPAAVIASTAAMPAGPQQGNTQPTEQTNSQASSQAADDKQSLQKHTSAAAPTRMELRAWQQAASRRAQYNAYGEAYQDVVLATLAQQPFKSYIGIWPAMAMANHSCSPNACVVLTGTGQLILRAVIDIAADSEVTISYAGSHAGSPVSVRRPALQSGFGFLCQCDRCLVEQDYEQEPVGKKAMLMHKKMEGSLRPQLLDALGGGNHDVIQSMLRQLSRLAHEYKVAVNKVADEEDQAVLQCASLPLVLELVSLCQRYITSTRLHEGAVARIRLGLERLQIVQRVAPGSYAHVQLGAAMLLDALKLGQQAVSDELVQECLQAHLARYGPITDVATLAKALHAHGNNTLADDIADAQVAAFAAAEWAAR